MTDTDLRRLAEQATPGPWHAPNPPDGVGEGMLYADDGWAIVDSFLFATEERRQATSGWRVPFTRPDGQHMRDAAYIAAANPQAILALLDERDQWREQAEIQADASLAESEAAKAAERRVAALEDERDSFKRLMLVAGGRVAALEEGLRRIADYDIGLPVEDESPIVFDYYRTIVRKARALLASGSAEAGGAAPSEPRLPIDDLMNAAITGSKGGELGDDDD